MASNLEFVSFKDFVENLPARTVAKSGDKTVVSNSTDGPGSETTMAQSQKIFGTINGLSEKSDFPQSGDFSVLNSSEKTIEDRKSVV